MELPDFPDAEAYAHLEKSSCGRKCDTNLVAAELGFSVRSITDEITEHLREADVIVADVSEVNPNVYYELGFAHGANKKVILLKQQALDRPLEVPFDIKVLRIHVYEFSTKGFLDLGIRLRDILINELTTSDKH